jgi:NAD(P)H-hydrate epimerase
LVTLGIARSLNPILEVKLTEAMTLPLPETKEQTLTKEAWDEVKSSGIRYKVICLGPGLSTHPAVKELVKRVIIEAETPLVIDADGLNVLAQDLEVLKEKKNDIILTPHPGEMARLVGLSVPEVLKDKLAISKKLATEYGVIVVLKMARTIVATPEGEIFINSTGNPAMASGGVGDVLTGVIGGLLAQGRPAKEATILGVFLHGLAGDLWVEERGRTGLLAQELADYLPKAREVVERGEE